jgi:TRAP-type C4-dicarboxylate transport system permease small subunit
MKRLGILEWFVVVLMLGLVVVVFAQVALRYLTYQPLAWTEEAGRYIFIWLSMMGAAAGGRKGAHFALDFLAQSLSSETRCWLRAGVRMTEAGFYGVLTWAGVQIVRVTHLQRSASIDIPMSLPYAAIPIAASLLAIFSVYQATKEIGTKLR